MLDHIIYYKHPLPDFIVEHGVALGFTFEPYHPGALFYVQYTDSRLGLYVPPIHSHAIYPHPVEKFKIHGKSLAGKALGKKTKVVIDATAGFGGDSLMFAAMGFGVIAIERLPCVYLLLYAYWKSLDTNISSKLQLQFGDACEQIQLLSSLESNNVDALYLDPMYPHKKKSALSNIHMQALQFLTAQKDHDDFDILLACAASSKIKRVVIKRPLNAAPISQLNLLHRFCGKSIAYEAYS